jgi:hypothetical protein
MLERDPGHLAVPVPAKGSVIVESVQPGALQVLGVFNELIIDELEISFDPMARGVQLAQCAGTVAMCPEIAKDVGYRSQRLVAIEAIVPVRRGIQA